MRYIYLFVDLQIGKKKYSESMICYWMEDGLGGYQMETRDYFIKNTDIIRSILRPTLHKIGRSRFTYIFPDFK